MNIHFAAERRERRVKIKVIGVGGAGGNAVNRMIENGLPDVDFYAINTDSQALEHSRAHQNLVIGESLTHGQGAGGDPEIGRQAAEEDRELLAALVTEADMVFVTAGMGGGTGTGAAPLVAAAARASGALTVAVVTRPFNFEGVQRMAQADAGLLALREQVDALLVIPNERLMEIDVPDSGMMTVFQIADNVLYEATKGISDIIAQHAVVNLDFADVRTVMRQSGAAIMGTGLAAGAGRAGIAAERAICSPLLEYTDILGSRAVLVYLTAACISRDDLREAMGHVQNAAGRDAHIFFGFAQDERMGEDLRVTVIATGFRAAEAQSRPEPISGAAVGLDRCAESDEPAVVFEPAGADESGESEPMPDEIEFLPAAESACCEQETPGQSAAMSDDPERYERFMERDETDSIEQRGLSEHAEPSERPERSADSGQPAEDLHLAAMAAVLEDCPGEEIDPSTSGGSVEASMAAAAGASSISAATTGQERPRSATGKLFLEPLASVRLQDQISLSAAPSGRYRDTARGEDMLRPAWERKYVD